MAQQNKTQLKTYFQTGDIPNATQYGEFIDSKLNLAETAIQVGEFSVSSSGNLKMMGSSSFVGDITSSGQISASAASTITAGTGSFSNLYAMNQNVRSSDKVTFAGIGISKTVASTAAWGTIDTTGNSFTVTISSVPTTAGESYSAAASPCTISNSNVVEDSVIIANSTSNVTVHPFRISDGSFRFVIRNMGSTAVEGSMTFSFLVI